MKLNRTALVIVTIMWAATFAPTIGAQQGPGPGQPQQQGPATQTPPPMQPVMTGGLTGSGKDYRISPGDVIQVRVEDAPELSHHYQVTAAGNIEMPVLGQILVRDKTTYELARLIANGLREQEYLKAPNVIVTVSQLNSRAFFIQGAILKPGLYQLESRPSLLTLISLAGGLSENHGSTIFILRPTKVQALAPGNRDSNLQLETQNPTTPNDSTQGNASDYELIKVNVVALYKGHFDQNQRLEPGDIVNIPRAGMFFVAGDVKAPGSFPLKDGTTLRQAISLAQGMTFKAKPAEGIIFREDPMSGSRQEIKVDISAVMKGKGDDILIRANDVIIVPNSQAKAIGGAILTSFGLNAFRFPIP
jgi:polysaccharide export outer membrane protein